MILWLVLFLLVVGISFILALQSMKDYEEIPQKSEVEYGLFLIRQSEKFDTNLLYSLNKLMLSENLTLSIERLFKGSQSALTIFGPRKILAQFENELSLLELEDYTANLNAEDLSVWEVGVKDTDKFNHLNLNNIFNNLSNLRDDEQFFWQVVFAARKDGDLSFQTQIRAVIFSRDPVRRKTIAADLYTIASGELTKIPRPFSTQQLLAFFKSRSLNKDSKGPVVSVDGAMRLLKI